MKCLLIFGLLIGGVFICPGQDLIATPEGSTELTGGMDLGEEEPLYLVSSMKTAKIITKEQFEKIDNDQVDYIHVINNPSSIAIYGDKARHGVVLIVMKASSLEKYSSKRRRQK
ncbi:MAG TPA: hypothetical protein VFZ52_09025 [Chryseolinea sp.]